MLITGRCHCGNISFTLEWLPEPQVIPARACSCSFCTAHRGVWTSSPGAHLQVRIKDHEQVCRQRFATGTADFHVCQCCGDVPLVTSRIDERLFAVVNVHALKGLPPGLVEYSAADFGEESPSDRIERRRQRWIADVSITGAPA